MTTDLLKAVAPTDLDGAFRLSKALSMAGDMIPKHFQGKPEAIMAAMIQGASVGFSPMQSLQSIAVINGRATLWGDGMNALILSAGHHIDVEIDGEGDKAVATATLTRKDGKQIKRSFSWEDAKRANLTGKQGPWQQYPKRMLSMRARAWAIRDGAADALMGLAVAEEVSDYGPETARDVTPKAAPKPGRALYLDPDPVDEVTEAPALPSPDRDALEGLADTLRDAFAERDREEVFATFGAELETLKRGDADLFGEVTGGK